MNKSKKGKEMPEEVVKLLNSIKWEPKYGAFQLSPDKTYARHEKFKKDLDVPRICYEVERAWDLYPYAENEFYYYFH